MRHSDGTVWRRPEARGRTIYVFFSAGFVAFYVSSVVVFAFVSFSIVSLPMVYILTCSDLYIFGITLFRYTAYALRF